MHIGSFHYVHSTATVQRCMQLVENSATKNIPELAMNVQHVWVIVGQDKCSFNASKGFSFSKKS